MAAGAVVGLAWRAVARRARWGAAPFLVAVLAAAGLAGRSDWPRWNGTTVAAGLLVGLAAAGAARLLADPAGGEAGLAAGALLSVAAVWAAVPETGPAVLVGGSLTGLITVAALARLRWRPAAGVALAAVVGWAALSGAAGRPWAAMGGALCTGLAPWWVLGPPRPARSPGRHSAGGLLLAAHGALALLAARWVGVDPRAGWFRVAVVAATGLAVTGVARRRA